MVIRILTNIHHSLILIADLSMLAGTCKCPFVKVKYNFPEVLV